MVCSVVRTDQADRQPQSGAQSTQPPVCRDKQLRSTGVFTHKQHEGERARGPPQPEMDPTADTLFSAQLRALLQVCTRNNETAMLGATGLR